MSAKKYPTKQDDEIMRALIHQVSKATPKGGTESDVVTFIAKPLWKAWRRAVGKPENSLPTEWSVKDCNRVYGSQTVVIPSESMWAISRAKKNIFTS